MYILYVYVCVYSSIYTYAPYRIYAHYVNIHVLMYMFIYKYVYRTYVYRDFGMKKYIVYAYKLEKKKK